MFDLTKADDPLALELVRFRVLGKPYSKWRAIIAETGESDTAFLICLKRQWNITINKAVDPMLFITQDTQQMRLLKESGVDNPTLLQILLTAKVIALSEEDAKDKFEKLLREQETQPHISSPDSLS